jgi:hypothetical protein
VFYVKNKDNEFVEPPRPREKHFAKTVSGFGNLLLSHMKPTTPLSRQAFVNTFRGRKHEIYQKAHDSLLNQGVSHKDAEVRVFVKCEKTDFTSKVDPVPRVISPRSPRYNVEVGRYLRKIEERVFRAIGKVYGHTTVIKGFDAQQSASLLYEKWGMFTQPVAVGLDASRFDQHVSIPALRFEHQCYVNMFAREKHKKELSRLLSWQLNNICRGYTVDGKLKYTTDGGRMSGDMNTSLGNCLLMCAMIYSYAEEKGIRIALANNGDDCVCFMDKDDVTKFQDGLFDWFLRMGFNMTMEKPVNDFEKIEFCQSQPVNDGKEWIMCRKPRTALAKDAVMIKPGNSVQYYRSWLDAVGKGGLALTGGLPVFPAFYRALGRAGCDKGKLNDYVFSWGVRHMIGDLKRSDGHVSPIARASFYTAFGITPDAQICLERTYDRATIDVGKFDQLTYLHDLPL